MPRWRRGDLVELDGLLAVVVGTEGEPDVPEGHVALWFGEPRCVRESEGGKGGERPEIWAIPEDMLAPGAELIRCH